MTPVALPAAQRHADRRARVPGIGHQGSGL
jgi:hypothetical protein